MTLAAWIALLAALASLPADGTAQPVSPAPPPSTAAADESACCTLPAGTRVDIEILDRVTSKLNKRGDAFAIRLASPIVAGGRTLIPAGAPGRGEVVHAAKAGGGGKAGELILAARYIEHEGRRIALRSFELSARGNDRGSEALAVATVASVAAFLVTGGQVDVAAGTRASAKLAEPLVAAPAGETAISQQGETEK